MEGLKAKAVRIAANFGAPLNDRAELEGASPHLAAYRTEGKKVYIPSRYFLPLASCARVEFHGLGLGSAKT